VGREINPVLRRPSSTRRKYGRLPELVHPSFGCGFATLDSSTWCGHLVSALKAPAQIPKLRSALEENHADRGGFAGRLIGLGFAKAPIG
jgi:hypothetical protein